MYGVAMRKMIRSRFSKDGSSKIITIRVPKDLLDEMSRYRRLEGVSVTFQLCKGAEMYLKEKGAWPAKKEE
jgi:hypothetical protein